MTLPLNQLHPRSVAARLKALAAPLPRMTPAQGIVLAYHNVTKGRPIPLNTRFVSARRLRADIRALRQIPGLRFVSLAEALDPGVPGPRVALTFDDGLRCALHTTLPVLEAENVPATLFVTTLDAHPPAEGHRRMLWADRIDLAAHQRHRPFTIGDETFRLDRRRIWRRGGDGKPLKSLCIARDVPFLDALAAVCDPGPALAPYWELLSAAELRRLADHPLITLAAHGVTHANLPSLSPEDRKKEMAVSRAWLENCVQQEITAFAYPHGRYTPDCPDIARRIGFSYQALMDYECAADALAKDLCRRIGNHPTCGARVQRSVIAAGGYGHERFR